MASEENAVGIDLGTTNSCVAVFKDGVSEVIPNNFQERTTPSMVIISKDGTRYVGKEAKLNQHKHIKNTIYESKRLIGRKYNEQCIQDRMLHWPFKVVEVDGNPKICVPQLNKTKKCFYPEEISGMILEKMKSIVEDNLHCSVNKAVITVPAYFNDNQRQATMDAAKIAGIDVLKIMNEPTAAALAYILKNGLIDIPSNTLVFDLGGGTFDVSIINTNGKQFTVIGVNGDPDLGGADFDILIYNEIVKIIQKQINERINFKTIQVERIKAQCVKVKEQLSSAMSAQFDLPAIIPDSDFDFEYTFTREDFEKLIRHLVKKIMIVVKKTLLDAKMCVEDIDNIVLVGGSSKIPAIKKNLQEFFKKDLSHAINPDEAVACGAAYQAAILTKNKDFFTNVVIVDVTPFSLGIEAEYVNMDVLIKKNAALPTKVTKLYTTVLDNQTELRITVFQGEDKLTANNTELGYFDLTGIPPAPARKPQIYVTFDINTNGVLHVTATERSSKETKAIEIVINTGRISKTDILRITKENKEYLKRQQELNKTAEEKNDFLNFCFKAKRTVEKTSSVSKEETNDFVSNANELIKYLENLSISETSLQTILKKRDEFQKRYYSLVTPL